MKIKITIEEAKNIVARHMNEVHDLEISIGDIAFEIPKEIPKETPKVEKNTPKKTELTMIKAGQIRGYLCDTMQKLRDNMEGGDEQGIMIPKITRWFRGSDVYTSKGVFPGFGSDTPLAPHFNRESAPSLKESVDFVKEFRYDYGKWLDKIVDGDYDHIIF